MQLQIPCMGTKSVSVKTWQVQENAVKNKIEQIKIRKMGEMVKRKEQH